MRMSIYKSLMNFFKIKQKTTPNEDIDNTYLSSNENLFFIQHTLEKNSNPMYYIDKKWIIKYCNKAFADYLNTNKDNLIGKNIMTIYSKDIGDSYYTQVKKLYYTKNKKTFIARLNSQEKPIKNVLFNEEIFIDYQRKTKGIIGSITDISEVLVVNQKINRLLKLKEAMLDLSQIIINENDINVLLNLVLEKVTVAIDKADIGAVLLVDKNNNVRIGASKGYDEAEVKNFSIKLDQVFYMIKTKGVIGKPIIINNVQDFEDSHNERALDSKDNDKLNSSLSTPILLNGKLYGFVNIESTTNNAFDENDIEVLEYLKQQIEIGISKNLLYEETIYLSRYDKLTKLYNRGYFEELFNDNLVRAKENNENFLFVILDLNWLKSINDTYGHLAGDELIRFFASSLRNKLKAPNILARIGGDEFAGIIFDYNDEKLVQTLEELSKELKEQPIYFEGNIFNCSFSYGVSCYSESKNDYNTLLKAADTNMYKYKTKFKATNSASGK